MLVMLLLVLCGKMSLTSCVTVLSPLSPVRCDLGRSVIYFSIWLIDGLKWGIVIYPKVAFQAQFYMKHSTENSITPARHHTHHLSCCILSCGRRKWCIISVWSWSGTWLHLYIQQTQQTQYNKQNTTQHLSVYVCTVVQSFGLCRNLGNSVFWI